MSVFKAMLKSKKFWYAIIAVVVAVLGAAKPEWAETTQNVLYSLVALILGQGVADIGKNKVT